MGTREVYADHVYAAAEAWVEHALKADDSLFTPGRPIWTSKWLDELHGRVLDRPDVSGNNFMDKLERQMSGSSREAYQLMAEVLYVHFLIDSKRLNTTKRERVERILGWSPEPVDILPNLIEGLTPGSADPGTGFNTYLPYHVGFIIEFVSRWKQLRSDQRQLLLDDPWAFKDFVMSLEPYSVLFRDYPVNTHLQRHALLHLVHPDTFLAIVSIKHKKMIVEAFEYLVEDLSQDIDRRLLEICIALERTHGETFSFYDSGIWEQWHESRTSDGWDRLITKAKGYHASGELNEIAEWHLEIGGRISGAREALLANSSDWPALVKKSVRNDLLFHVYATRFGEWIDQELDDAFLALTGMWSDDGSYASERVGALMRALPSRVISGPGNRAKIASVLLMGLDAREFPSFGVKLFNRGYDSTGYETPRAEADEAELYDHALGFLDQVIEEASERGLVLRHRLDARSALWAFIQEGETPPNGNESLDELAIKLSLPVEFLEEIKWLLEDKKQVIFQGPPGTGKTFVAQELAQCLAESDERVTLVQLHPSYAYEDFVQGYRPALRDGQPMFELKDGPLLSAAHAARDEPQAKHFLVIDEINRGNVAKVFGELYFLLEYRDKEMRLQYSESDMKFSLPKNLYIIGTMNTADRSIALVDLALRRRFHFKEFHPDAEPIKSLLRRWLKNPDNGATAMESVADVVDRANAHLSDNRHAAIGPSHFMKKNLTEADAERIWKHSVLPYIEERLIGSPPDRMAEFEWSRLRSEDTPSATEPSDEHDVQPAERSDEQPGDESNG